MSFSGKNEWTEQLSALCDPGLKWKDPRDMHRRCSGTFLAKSGQTRVYARCPCPCHKKKREPGID